MKALLNLILSVLPACGAFADLPAVFEPIEAVHQSQSNVGLGMVLRAPNTPEVEGYLGFADYENQMPVTRATRFQVMSVTKAFIGAALVKAATAGKLSLDATVHTYLPRYPSKVVGSATLKQLAAHTSGLPHLSHPSRKALYVERFPSAIASLRTFEGLALLSEPGDAYHYSSAGYNLLAAVLETVYDKPISQVLEETVLSPLALGDTSIGDVYEPISGLAKNYTFVDVWTYAPLDDLQRVPTWDFSFNPGGGNLITTASDLARFGEAFTRAGYFSEAELAMFQSPIDANKSAWSFGWFASRDEQGAPYLSISGATPGVQAGLIVYPDPGLVMAVLANSWGRSSSGGDLVIGAPLRSLQTLLLPLDR